MTDDQADPCGIVMATLSSCALRDRYRSEQRELQPDLRDALVKALRDRLGDGFTVQISVNEGRPPDAPKPHVALFGTSFWPDIVVLRAGAPVLGVEVKHIRTGESPSSAIAETVGHYIARQMGHYSAGFTLETYGHLMDALPRRQVEFIDELVFPEGWKVALKLHLCGAPQGAVACSPTQSGEASKPLENQENCNVVQSDAAGCMVPPARFELALPA